MKNCADRQLSYFLTISLAFKNSCIYLSHVSEFSKVLEKAFLPSNADIHTGIINEPELELLTTCATEADL